MGKSCKRNKCRKCYKTKRRNEYDVKVKCQPAHQDGSADASEWNLAIFPDPETSTFRATPNADTEGKYVSVSNIVHNHANFKALGLGNASMGDLFNTLYTLEVDAVANSVNGFSIYWTEVESNKGSYIKLIQTDLSYEDRVTARVHNVNITEAGSTAAPASAQFEGFVFITHEAL